MTRRGFLGCAAGWGFALLTHTSVALGQSNFPERPIRLIVPFPPGGAFDTVGRPWAEKMKPLLGTVVLENIGGGGSSVGAAQAAHARPDGYTLLLGGATTHVPEALLKTRPLYDPLKELEPVSGIAITAFAIAVHPSVPVGTLNELIAYAKSNPGKLSYGSAGHGSLNHLTGELFKLKTGITDLVLGCAKTRWKSFDRRRFGRIGSLPVVKIKRRAIMPSSRPVVVGHRRYS
jgi:tripartite-type tricarboxylate transporter receptor subunit TctC